MVSVLQKPNITTDLQDWQDFRDFDGYVEISGYLPSGNSQKIDAEIKEEYSSSFTVF